MPEAPNTKESLLGTEHIDAFEMLIYGAVRPNARRTYSRFSDEDLASMPLSLDHNETKKIRFYMRSVLTHAAFRPHPPFWSRDIPDTRKRSTAIEMSGTIAEYSQPLYALIRHMLLEKYDIWVAHMKKHPKKIPEQIKRLFPRTWGLRNIKTKRPLENLLTDSFYTLGGGLTSGIRTTLRALSLGIRLYTKKHGTLPSHEDALRIARSAYPIAIFITQMHQETQSVFEYVLEKNPPQPQGPIEFQNTVDQWDESLFSLEGNTIRLNSAAVMNKARTLFTPEFREKHIPPFDQFDEEAATFGCPALGGIRDVFEYTLSHVPPSFTQEYPMQKL